MYQVKNQTMGGFSGKKTFRTLSFLFGLAWKNLSRYRRRTIITVIVIAFGIAMYIWVDSILLGAEEESERNLVYYETGAAKIMRKDFWKNIDYLPLKYSFIPSKSLEDTLSSLGIVYTPRVSFIGEVYTNEGSLPVKVVGINPKQDDRVYDLAEVIGAGRYLEPKDTALQGVLLGRTLSRNLGVKVGDVLILKTRTKDGAFQALDLEVVGVIDSSNPKVNNGTLFVTLDLCNRVLGLNGSVTELSLYFPDWKKPYEKLKTLNDRLKINQDSGRFVVKSWRDMAADFIAISQGKRSGTAAILFLIFIIAAVGISNTMLMAVYERIKEIGMMRAMGMKDSSIRLAFILEAGGIGFIGSLVGVAIGAAGSYFFVKYGIDFSAYMQDMDIGYRVSGVFRGAWDAGVFLVSFVFGIIVSMGIALLPASRALKMEITECLRHN